LQLRSRCFCVKIADETEAEGGREMGMITSFRAPLPAIDTGHATQETRAASLAAASGSPSVTQTALARAVQHIPAKPSAVDPRLLDAPMTAETSAAQAAEEARQAYIRASIAAGISPLPLG
jgi:hypothetical protein